jgi:hypothetical protein
MATVLVQLDFSFVIIGIAASDTVTPFTAQRSGLAPSGERQDHAVLVLNPYIVPTAMLGLLDSREVVNFVVSRIQ